MTWQKETYCKYMCHIWSTPINIFRNTQRFASWILEVTYKQKNFAHTATFRCSSLALWDADPLQQHDAFNSVGRAAAKKVPVGIANGSVCTVISALLFWDHPQTGAFILPSYAACSVSFAACSSWAPRGCYDFNPKLWDSLQGVEAQLPSAPQTAWRGLRPHLRLLPVTLDILGLWWHPWKRYEQLGKEEGVYFWIAPRKQLQHFLSGRRVLPGKRDACLIASKFSPLKSFNLSRLPLCKPPAHVRGWT